MKEKGVCEQNPQGVQHRETTREEGVKVITFHDDVGWNWSRIGQHLNIDQRTCTKVCYMGGRGYLGKVFVK